MDLKSRNLTKLKPEDSYLPYEQSVKYLGVTIDSKLSWTQHVKNKIMKAKRLLMLAKHSISKCWGPNPKYAKWAYTGIIRPALSYGSLVWSRVCDNQTIILKLK